jgi:hypothetical protein
MSKQTTMQIEKRKKEKCTWNGTCQTFDYCKDTSCTKKHNNKLVQNTKNQTCNIIEYRTCNVLKKKMKTSSQQASLRRRQRGTHKCQWG